jgi:hypothetical protein
MSIANRAVLVQLNISTWGTERLDKKQTERVNALNNADSKAGKVHKDLMCGTNLAKDIDMLAARCRLWNNEQTMPWQDRGARLLPTSMFMSYKEEMNRREKHFYSLVNKFIPNYEEAKQTARNYLADMYNEQDYPDSWVIASKYNWSLVVAPVPESGHFCIDVPADELVKVKASCDAEVERRLVDAMRKPWEDLHRMLLTMSEKLKERDANDDKAKRFHDSFVSNALDLCGLLTHMNVTGDSKLEQARRQLEQAMTGVEVDGIKDCSATRANVKSKLDSILKQFEF